MGMPHNRLGVWVSKPRPVMGCFRSVRRENWRLNSLPSADAHFTAP